MPQPYPFIPWHFEFRAVNPVLRVLYLFAGVLGFGLAYLLASSHAGRVLIAAIAILATASIPVLHLCVYYNKGNPDDPPTNELLHDLTMNVGGVLTLLYSFSGFLVTGLGAGVVLVLHHPLVWVGVVMLVAGSLWLVPYSVWLMWK